MSMGDGLDQTIQAEVDQWSASSNECTQIQLVRDDGHVTASFSPEFTYPIFGEEEAIFGYQDLDITISFAAHNLTPHVAIQYSKAFPTQGEIKPTDIAEALADFLPASAFSKKPREEALRDANAATFQPPGEKIHEYQRNDEHFEIWMASLDDARARELVENIQILMIMFIEGASTLQLEQEWTAQRWKVFFLYKKQSEKLGGSPYSLVGYGTSYRVFALADRYGDAPISEESAPPSTDALDEWLQQDSHESPLQLASRERLSQFLILPTFHRAGHGLELYNSMYRQLADPTNVREVTVEDPNESFDNLRDVCDLLMLRKRDDFAALRVNTTLSRDALNRAESVPVESIVPEKPRMKILRETKLMQRQFDRLIEMHTLSAIPHMHRSKSRITRKEKSSNEQDRAYYFWRLYVKQRLFLFNRDQLSQLEHEERVEKLEAALDSVQEGYEQILERVEAKEADMNVAAPSKAKRVNKRKIVEEDEDEDDSLDSGSINGETPNGSVTKKTRNH